ncbi:MAG: SMC-Scp complex subunit ScpB [Candidatus Krumholzibacteriota bacterium]|nr:SMC-Scp complex subunit ScpB [Candidatus Krumholzibacteriota bacterium]
MDNDFDKQREHIIEKQVEALLFASDTPLSARKLAKLTEAPSGKYITSAIESLSTFYAENFRSFQIAEIAGGFQLTTLPEFSSIVKKLYKNKRKSKLSRAALETLAIIAYKQSVSRHEIEDIRGVNSDGVLSTLTERELITVSGRGDGIGKPFLYSTTKKFLEYLGLKNYRELPAIEEFETEIQALDILNYKLNDGNEDIENEDGRDVAQRGMIENIPENNGAEDKSEDNKLDECGREEDQKISDDE